MGFSVGRITKVHPMPPGDPLHRGVRVEFEITDPYFRYIQTSGSYLKVNAAGFLNQRELEITRGTNGVGSYEVVVTQPISILPLDEAKKMAAESPGHWQLAQDVLDEKSNVVFHAFEPVEKVLDASTVARASRNALNLNPFYLCL